MADRGNLWHLVRLFAQVRKRALTKAIGAAVDVKPAASVEEAVAATRDMLLDLGRIVPAQYLIAKDIAGAVGNRALSKLNDVTSALAGEIALGNSAFAFETKPLFYAPADELRQLAEKLQYHPNTNDYHQTFAAMFTASGVESRIVVSFHSVGKAFRGLVVAVCYFQVGDGPPAPLSDDVFRIGYQETATEVSKRYDKWLDDCLIKGLAEWRRTLV